MSSAAELLAGIKARAGSESVSLATVVRFDMPRLLAAVEAVLDEADRVYAHHYNQLWAGSRWVEDTEPAVSVEDLKRIITAALEKP